MSQGDLLEQDSDANRVGSSRFTPGKAPAIFDTSSSVFACRSGRLSSAGALA